MSQLNNRNSYPTIPALVGNRVDSPEHSPSNYAGLSLNTIDFSDKRIRNKMIELNNFMITLSNYIDEVCHVLQNKYEKYIKDIKLENISTGFYKEFYKEYNTVITTYKKLISDLKSFSSDIRRDFTKVLEWMMNLDLSEQKYIKITKECDELERNRHVYQDNDFEVNSDRAKSRQLYWKKYFNLKSQKNMAAQQYNKQFADFNQFMVKISILISHITEGRIFYTPIINSQKDYTISLKDFVDEFGKLVSMTDDSMKKKGEVIAKLINESMKNLDKTTEAFDNKKMNCLIYLYHDDKLRSEYSPNQYKKIISKRNDIIWALCRTYFEHVFKYDKTNRKTITITEPVSSSTNNKTSKFSEKKLMHQVTLVLFCGNSQQMSDEYLDIQDMHHYTHYMKYKESLSFEVLNDRLRSLSVTYESCGLTRASVVVLDLDDTLIDDSIRPRSRRLIDQLNEFKRIFNYVVLWSHGTSEHVRDSLRTVKIPENFFDVTITRPTLQSCGSNKGIGIVMAELYTRYQVRELTFSCIVDDLPRNFTDDYMLYVNVPGNSKVEDLTEFYTWALKEITQIKNYCESHDGISYISVLNW